MSWDLSWITPISNWWMLFSEWWCCHFCSDIRHSPSIISTRIVWSRNSCCWCGNVWASTGWACAWRGWSSSNWSASWWYLMRSCISPSFIQRDLIIQFLKLMSWCVSLLTTAITTSTVWFWGQLLLLSGVTKKVIFCILICKLPYINFIFPRFRCCCIAKYRRSSLAWWWPYWYSSCVWYRANWLSLIVLIVGCLSVWCIVTLFALLIFICN